MPDNITERVVLSVWLLFATLMWLMPFTPHPRYYNWTLRSVWDGTFKRVSERFVWAQIVKYVLYVYLFFFLLAYMFYTGWWFGMASPPGADPSDDSAPFIGLCMGAALIVGGLFAYCAPLSAHVFVAFLALAAIVAVEIGPTGNEKADFAGRALVFLVVVAGVGGVFTGCLACVTAELMTTLLVWLHHFTYAFAVSLVFALSLVHAIDGLREQMARPYADYKWVGVGALAGMGGRLLWVSLIVLCQGYRRCLCWPISPHIVKDTWPFPSRRDVRKARAQDATAGGDPAPRPPPRARGDDDGDEDPFVVGRPPFAEEEASA